MKKVVYLGLASWLLPVVLAFAQQATPQRSPADPPAILPPVVPEPTLAPVEVYDVPTAPPRATLGAPTTEPSQPADLAPYTAFKNVKAPIVADSNKAPVVPDCNYCPNNNCGPRMWTNFEVLVWWTKGIPVNTPLLTQATNFPADPTSGSLGSKNTVTALGGQSYGLATRLGGRFTLGGWFSSEELFGLESNYFFISPQSTGQTLTTNGSIVYGLPYFNVNTRKETMIPLSGPASLFGSDVAGSASLRVANLLQGTELNVVARLISTNRWDLIGLAGFRYLNFTEGLDYTASNAITGVTGQQSSFHDSFQASNNFYGGQLGLRGLYRDGNLTFTATAKAALGSMNQLVRVNGAAEETNPGFGPNSNFANSAGGFYALPTNIGHHSQSAFCVIPEVDLKIGYNVTRRLTAFVGYNFLYLSDVTRPGTTIDHAINPTQSPGISGFPNTLVGPPAPTFAFSRTDFWAQGINLGLQFVY